jgi:hypothetical protein
MKWDVEPDKVVVAAAALAEGRDKAQDEWEGQPPGRVASVPVRRVDIVNRTFPDSPAPQNSARNVGHR